MLCASLCGCVCSSLSHLEWVQRARVLVLSCGYFDTELCLRPHLSWLKISLTLLGAAAAAAAAASALLILPLLIRAHARLRNGKARRSGLRILSRNYQFDE